jgi:hypothetical protein
MQWLCAARWSGDQAGAILFLFVGWYRGPLPPWVPPPSGLLTNGNSAVTRTRAEGCRGINAIKIVY